MVEVKNTMFGGNSFIRSGKPAFTMNTIINHNMIHHAKNTKIGLSGIGTVKNGARKWKHV